MKLSPMKNTRTANTNKKQNYTFTKNQKRKETLDVRQLRKAKQNQFNLFAEA